MERKSLTNQYSELIFGSICLLCILITLRNDFFFLTLTLSILFILSARIIKSVKKSIPSNILFWFHDFSGTYKGVMKSEFYDSEGKLQIVKREHLKIVYQTGNKITIHTFTKKADQSVSSFSHRAVVQLENGQENYCFKVHYPFVNQEQGNQPLIPEGEAELSFKKEHRGKIIFGTYVSKNNSSKAFKTQSHLKKVTDFDVSKF